MKLECYSLVPLFLRPNQGGLKLPTQRARPILFTWTHCHAGCCYLNLQSSYDRVKAFAV